MPLEQLNPAGHASLQTPVPAELYCVSEHGLGVPSAQLWPAGLLEVQIPGPCMAYSTPVHGAKPELQLWPSGHMLHTPEPASENVTPGHAEIPPFVQLEPAGHGMVTIMVQLLDPGTLQSCSVHASRMPSGQLLPAGHSLHTPSPSLANVLPTHAVAVPLLQLNPVGQLIVQLLSP